MLHTFVALVEDRPGVLTRVASLFRRLNVNIVSLTVGRSEKSGVSRMTIVSEASPTAGHRIMASLYKLENVLDVDDVTQSPSVARELALIKVIARGEPRGQALQIADAFRAKIVDTTIESFVFELTGGTEKIDAFLDLMRPLGLAEISRSGVAAIARGTKTIV